MQWNFEDWGATAVLTGHEHLYERILRDDNGDGDTLPYFVTGLGGNGRYGFGTPVDGSQVRYSADYGTMVVEAGPTAHYLRILVDCRWRYSRRQLHNPLPSNANSATFAQPDLAVVDSEIDEEPTFDEDAPSDPGPDPLVASLPVGDLFLA